MGLLTDIGVGVASPFPWENSN